MHCQPALANGFGFNFGKSVTSFVILLFSCNEVSNFGSILPFTRYNITSVCVCCQARHIVWSVAYLQVCVPKRFCCCSLFFFVIVDFFCCIARFFSLVSSISFYSCFQPNYTRNLFIFMMAFYSCSLLHFGKCIVYASPPKSSYNSSFSAVCVRFFVRAGSLKSRPTSVHFISVLVRFFSFEYLCNTFLWVFSFSLSLQ